VRAERIEQRELLRIEQPLPETTIVVRGGRDTVDKLRHHAQRTARAWTLDGQPLLGVSVFAVLGISLEQLLARRFASLLPHDLPANSQPTALLDEARDPTQITPGALVVAGDEDAAAICQVVDLVPAGDGTIVHLRLLPGLVDDYRALVDRALAS
jgi:hypothetical protein